MSDDLPGNLRPVADFFGLVGTAPVEKDFHVVRALAAVASIDAAPFTLVFGGGTALARAHKIIRRMSEDVDFKIVPCPAAAVSRSILRQQLGTLRARVTDALLAAGFAFDPADPACTRSRNENRYTMGSFTQRYVKRHGRSWPLKPGALRLWPCDVFGKPYHGIQSERRFPNTVDEHVFQRFSGDIELICGRSKFQGFRNTATCLGQARR